MDPDGSASCSRDKQPKRPIQSSSARFSHVIRQSAICGAASSPRKGTWRFFMKIPIWWCWSSRPGWWCTRVRGDREGRLPIDCCPDFQRSPKSGVQEDQASFIAWIRTRAASWWWPAHHEPTSICPEPLPRGRSARGTWPWPTDLRPQARGESKNPSVATRPGGKR